VDCATNPGRRCSTSFPDPITGDCLSRALAAAQVAVLRQCAGSDCPECYGGGTNCPSYASFAFSQEAAVLGQAIATLYCDDSSSADGLTHAEQVCQRGIARASGRFFETLQHCFRNCQKAVQRGATGFSSCGSAFLDTERFDPRTQHCIDRARARLVGSCDDHCADPPDCFPYSCSETAQLVETQALGAEPATYCSDSICGDGVISGAELCDPFASPSGCGVGEHCVNCTTCEAICGDGLVSPREACDPPGTRGGCAVGEVCGSDCTACNPCPATTVVPADGGVFSGSTSGTSSLGSCGASGSSPEQLFEWVPSKSGTATIQTCDPGTDYDTVLYIRSGDCVGPELACNDDFCGFRSSITPTVTAGETYIIVVDGFGGSSGSFTLTITSASPNAAFLDGPSGSSKVPDGDTR